MRRATMSTFSVRATCLAGGMVAALVCAMTSAEVAAQQTTTVPDFSSGQVVMVYSGDAQVRRVYLNVPHSENPQPTWYGESVGHYEGDTLVVDTIGMNDKTFVDNYRTPHTTKLHVVERWRVVEEGKTLEV